MSVDKQSNSKQSERSKSDGQTASGPSNENHESIHAPTLLQAVINAVPTPIFFKDAEGRYLGCNDAFEDFVGRKREEFIGKDVFELWEPELAEIYDKADRALFERGGHQVYEGQVSAQGKLHEVVFNKAVFHAESEQVSGIVGAILDITERKRYQDELETLATTDSLTALANRHALYEHLKGANKRARRSGNPLTLLSIDLDGFKEINDTHGHHIGDEVLKQVARRFISAVRDTDLVARLGGDEFVIVLEDAGSEAEVSQIAANIICMFESPIQIEELFLSMGVSIGIADPPGVSDVDELLREADRALYIAKSNGKNRYARLTGSQ